MLAVRVRDAEWETKARFDISQGTARLVLGITPTYWCSVDALRGRVEARARVGDIEIVLGWSTGTGENQITIFIRAEAQESASLSFTEGPDTVRLGFVDEQGDSAVIAQLDGRVLSTEVAGGFTGRVIGVTPMRDDARLISFEYATMVAMK